MGWRVLRKSRASTKACSSINWDTEIFVLNRRLQTLRAKQLVSQARRTGVASFSEGAMVTFRSKEKMAPKNHFKNSNTFYPSPLDQWYIAHEEQKRVDELHTSQWEQLGNSSQEKEDKK
eukprot:TRINITY_DN14181_c0_g1_i1.p1 TRINITY_DN14181_c0_g1~~TRINITY_DN14181_c0_g1_i1.p1  ORF type:complete len:119 (-),score=8.81 TRINITY_DN14181_c0_g1_i1:170-526(-)